MTGDDRHREGPSGREAEPGRPAALASAATYATWTGIHRVNMVRPSVATPPKIPTATQPAASEPDSRWITENTGPVRAGRTWPTMTGAGSRLAAAPRSGTPFFDQPDSQQVEPEQRGDEPADQGSNTHGLSSQRTKQIPDREAETPTGQHEPGNL